MPFSGWQRVLPRELPGPDMQLNTDLNLVPNLKMRVAVPPFFRMLSCCTWYKDIVTDFHLLQKNITIQKKIKVISYLKLLFVISHIFLIHMDLNLSYCTIYDSKLIGICTSRPTAGIKWPLATVTCSEVSRCRITLVSFDLITQDIWGSGAVACFWHCSSTDVFAAVALCQGESCTVQTLMQKHVHH
jgi:hypothetical protein